MYANATAGAGALYPVATDGMVAYQADELVDAFEDMRGKLVPTFQIKVRSVGELNGNSDQKTKQTTFFCFFTQKAQKKRNARPKLFSTYFRK